MPRGPKGEKRPADVIGNAVHVMRIATGEIEDKPSKAPGRGRLKRYSLVHERSGGNDRCEFAQARDARPI